MRNHRNIRRNNFRNNDRDYRQNGSKIFKSNPNNNFQRRSPGKNNHNAPRLIEKYNDLASEALSNGDKILSENYYQHADHFLRVSLEQSSSNNLNKKNYNNKNMLKDSSVQTLSEKDIKTTDQNINIETKE